MSITNYKFTWGLENLIRLRKLKRILALEPKAYNKKKNWKLGVWRGYSKLAIYKWQSKHFNLIGWGSNLLGCIINN